MRRAPQIEVNEKRFRRAKRASFARLVKEFKEFRKGVGYTPLNVRDLAEIENALSHAHKKLVPWWHNR